MRWNGLLLEQSTHGFYPHLYMAEYCRFLDPVRETARFQAILASARELVETFPQKEAALNDPFPASAPAAGAHQ